MPLYPIQEEGSSPNGNGDGLAAQQGHEGELHLGQPQLYNLRRSGAEPVFGRREALPMADGGLGEEDAREGVPALSTTAFKMADIGRLKDRFPSVARTAREVWERGGGRNFAFTHPIY